MLMNWKKSVRVGMVALFSITGTVFVLEPWDDKAIEGPQPKNSFHTHAYKRSSFIYVIRYDNLCLSRPNGIAKPNGFVGKPQSFPFKPNLLLSSTTYPVATGLNQPPPVSGIGNGGFLRFCVKKTGWHLNGS
jgi:hypothetical protein